MQNLLIWIENNCEWIFDGIGVCVVGAIFTIVGWIVKNVNKSSKNEMAEKTVDNSIYHENILGNKNIAGKHNTINIYNSKDALENKEEKSLFSTRFIIVQKLLNNSRIYDEKEYTLEYMSSLVGIKNVGEMKEYVKGSKEPDEEIKQRFVDVFGVNRDWMLYNQGEYPFASNLRKYKNGVTIFDDEPMDILRNEQLSEIQKFIIVVGRYENRRSVLIIRKISEVCYEIYPSVFDLDSHVGLSGRSKLISFYRFLREANKIGKIYGIVYKATEEQFRELHLGLVAPMIVRKYEVFKCFTEDFIDLSPAQFERDERFWDEDLVKVKRIIQSDIENVDRVNGDSDAKRIQMNLAEGN